MYTLQCTKYVKYNIYIIVMVFTLPLFQLSDGRSFKAKIRFDTDVELTYFKHGGILNYMIRSMLNN